MLWEGKVEQGLSSDQVRHKTHKYIPVEILAPDLAKAKLVVFGVSLEHCRMLGHATPCSSRPERRMSVSSLLS